MFIEVDSMAPESRLPKHSHNNHNSVYGLLLTALKQKTTKERKEERIGITLGSKHNIWRSITSGRVESPFLSRLSREFSISCQQRFKMATGISAKHDGDNWLPQKINHLSPDSSSWWFAGHVWQSNCRFESAPLHWFGEIDQIGGPRCTGQVRKESSCVQTNHLCTQILFQCDHAWTLRRYWQRSGIPKRDQSRPWRRIMEWR